MIPLTCDTSNPLRQKKQNRSNQGIRGGGKRKLLFNRYRVSVCDDKKVLEIDSGRSCTTL